MEKSLEQLFIQEFQELNEIPTHEENLSFSQTVQFQSFSKPTTQNNTARRSKQENQANSLHSFKSTHVIQKPYKQPESGKCFLRKINQEFFCKLEYNGRKALTQATTSFILTEKIKARDKYKDIYIHERNKALLKGGADKKRGPKVKTRKFSGNSPSIFEALTLIAKQADDKEKKYHKKIAEQAYFQQMMFQQDEFNKRVSAGSFDYGSYHRNQMISKQLEQSLAKRRSVSPQITEDVKEYDSSSEDLKPQLVEEINKKKPKKRASSSISNQVSLKKENSSSKRPMKAKASLDTHISTAAESNLTLSHKQKCSKGSSILFDENIIFNDL